MGRPPPLVAVSLKMYFDHRETLEWCSEVVSRAGAHPAIVKGAVDLAILPGLTALKDAVALSAGTPIAVGAQNLHGIDRGAFTGEVSGLQLAQAGCKYVEVGHAERRRLFGEDDALVAQKVAGAVRNGLVPIICVGETARGPASPAADECVAQLQSALGDAAGDPAAEIVVAYEPVWAIGQPDPAPTDHIDTVIGRLSAAMISKRGRDRVRVIYGGSAGPGVLQRLGHSCDGLFLGRFAHDVESLLSVIDEASALRRNLAQP